MKKIRFGTIDKAREYFSQQSQEKFTLALLANGLDKKELDDLNIEQLSEKLRQVNALLSSVAYIENNTYFYNNNDDFIIISEDAKGLAGFQFSIEHALKHIADYILNRIKRLEQKKAVDALSQIAEEITNPQVKSKLDNELEKIVEQNKKYEKMLADVENKHRDKLELLEVRKKVDLENLERISSIFLRFLDKESVASIIGALLLLYLGYNVVQMMKVGKEPIKIVESAFLLLLGYFFGHSTNKHSK